MNIIIDTHIFIWLLKDPERLGAEHTQVLKSPHDFFLSSISIAEIMIKSSIGKLNLGYEPLDMALKSGLKILDFKGEDASYLKKLPLHHKDPFDRMLIAQSLCQEFPIMTRDKKFKHYECTLV
ncbi:type II toxin-antitoxin system VapC family toxin [sulfur-oxidizing endosymbiont of Gigantopelta aegis]|uniref:type II toxin-antitoxin system VapC family toxin n=1 Tax=sulfur-oxidizing endosymbiont of Gigantopelta aegis TaxID=2794934 RepID=UPI0018DBFDB4|nr:type II toxin-antitoxin system VapC family toxin [sulfur-oxidizing endosymbiont of Gigantopelta aegis]